MTSSPPGRCGHCKNLAPHWAAAATELKGKVKLGALDATTHTVMASKYQVGGGKDSERELSEEERSKTGVGERRENSERNNEREKRERREEQGWKELKEKERGKERVARSEKGVKKGEG